MRIGGNRVGGCLHCLMQCWEHGVGKVESEGWLGGGFGADVNMHGGGDLDRLESEGPWGRHGGPEEPGCRAVDPSAYVPEGSPQGPGEAGQLRLLDDIGTFGFQQHVGDGSRGHGMDATRMATVTGSRDRHPSWDWE